MKLRDRLAQQLALQDRTIPGGSNAVIEKVHLEDADKIIQLIGKHLCVTLMSSNRSQIHEALMRTESNVT